MSKSMRRWLGILLTVMLMLPARAESVSASLTLGDERAARNAMRAAQAMDGLLLSAGDSFSFNELVGPRTEERGFELALNGRGVDVVGGGVAQAASALYVTLLKLPGGSVSFDELAFYGDGYAGDYVDDGSLAVMVDYDANRDFRFTNCSGQSLHLTFEAEEDVLTCRIDLEADEVGMGRSATSAPMMEDGAAIRASASVSLLCDGGDAALENIALAAGSVNDWTLAKGDTFSFNDAVGERTLESGYGFALDARGEEIVGGGAAQVASALWMLVQQLPDVAIVEKCTYGSAYNQSYVAASSDAIMVDGGTNFVFRYDGEGYLTLYAVLEGDTLFCAAALSD